MNVNVHKGRTLLKGVNVKSVNVAAEPPVPAKSPVGGVGADETVVPGPKMMPVAVLQSLPPEGEAPPLNARLPVMGTAPAFGASRSERVKTPAMVLRSFKCFMRGCTATSPPASCTDADGAVILGISRQINAFHMTMVLMNRQYGEEKARSEITFVMHEDHAAHFWIRPSRNCAERDLDKAAAAWKAARGLRAIECAREIRAAADRSFPAIGFARTA
jgi:hypothetical protein